MNDLEICKRIAEIEGLLVSAYKLGNDDLWVHTCNTKDSSVTLYNPLTDDALWAGLCFQLMVKYKLEVWEVSGKWLVGFDDLQNIVSDESLNRAICLLIIEAHEEQ